MTSVLMKTWALFFGFAIISLAHGLQGTLLGVRAILEGLVLFQPVLLLLDITLVI